MQLPYLQISSVDGQIGMKAHRPPLEIKQPNADLSIKQDHFTTVQISHTASQLLIDQKEAFADANLKGPLRSSNEFISKIKQKVMEYISRTSSQGDQMMRIENGTEIFPRLAAQNSQLYPDRELNITSMPRPFQVKFQYTPSQVSFDVKNSQPEINVRRNEPKISIPKWQTDTYVRQKNNLNIQAIGLQVNLQR